MLGRLGLSPALLVWSMIIGLGGLHLVVGAGLSAGPRNLGWEEIRLAGNDSGAHAHVLRRSHLGAKLSVASFFLHK